jgi:hypothetical protein
MPPTDTTAIDQQIDRLYNERLRADIQIARLSLRAIACRVRDVLPAAATVGLTWSENGDWLNSTRCYTADGDELVSEATDLLDDRIGDYCVCLTSSNQPTWAPFTTAENGNLPPALRHS